MAVVGLPQGVAAVAISGGFYMTCAALEDGSAWCWGENRDGALGDGTETRRNSAVQVVGVGGVGVLTNAARISCGGVGAHPFCCAQADDDSAWCWGGNDFGKLGTHSTSPSKTSVPVAVQW